MFELRAATPADRSEVLALIREMIPGGDAEARWRWLYADNPGGTALTWLATEDGRVAGCTSLFPFRMWLDGDEVRGSLGGDGYVRPAFRRRGLGALLHDASRTGLATHRLACMYGAPGAMNLTPLKHAGSRQVGHVARWVRPLRAAGLGLRVPGLGRLPIAWPPRGVELAPMRRGDERVDEVWAAARGDLRLAAVRDAAFYTWRFLEGPARRQPPYVIVADDRPIGVCALEPMHDGTALRIVDLLAVPGAWHTCLGAIAHHGVRTSAATVLSIVLFALDGRRRQLWRSGFTERDGKPFLCMIPDGGDRRFLDPDRWYYNGADSDLDSLD